MFSKRGDREKSEKKTRSWREREFSCSVCFRASDQRELSFAATRVECLQARRRRTEDGEGATKTEERKRKRRALQVEERKKEKVSRLVLLSSSQ